MLREIFEECLRFEFSWVRGDVPSVTEMSPPLHEIIKLKVCMSSNHVFWQKMVLSLMAIYFWGDSSQKVDERARKRNKMDELEGY